VLCNLPPTSLLSIILPSGHTNFPSEKTTKRNLTERFYVRNQGSTNVLTLTSFMEPRYNVWPSSLPICTRVCYLTTALTEEIKWCFGKR